MAGPPLDMPRRFKVPSAHSPCVERTHLSMIAMTVLPWVGRSCGGMKSNCRSYRDLEEFLAERGIEVDHVTWFQWVQRFTPQRSFPADFGSPIWTRTRNPSINSRMLCQLSYGGLWQCANSRRRTISIPHAVTHPGSPEGLRGPRRRASVCLGRQDRARCRTRPTTRCCRCRGCGGRQRRLPHLHRDRVAPRR